MPEQSELDLPVPKAASRRGRRRGFAGHTRGQMLAGVMALSAAAWAAWATRTLLLPPRQPIVAARLSAIVGDYVQAQARSATPPAQVQAEMRVFMATLDKELQRRSADGQIVLVGEAVLTRNVPDITDALRRAVYAAGVAEPHAASAADLERLGAQALPAGQPASAGMVGGRAAPISGTAMQPAQAEATAGQVLGGTGMIGGVNGVEP